MCKLAVGMFVVLHYFACLWYMVGSLSANRLLTSELMGGDEEKSSWVTAYLLGGDGDNVGIAPVTDADQIPLGSRYLASLYWAVTTTASVG